jgi:hypothetical protein
MQLDRAVPTGRHCLLATVRLTVDLNVPKPAARPARGPAEQYAAVRVLEVRKVLPPY